MREEFGRSIPRILETCCWRLNTHSFRDEPPRQRGVDDAKTHDRILGTGSFGDEL